MSVATWLQTNFATQSGSVYKAAIDGDFAVASRIVNNFSPHQRSTLAMKVTLEPGVLFVSGALVEHAAQDTGTITAPGGNPRIDFVVVDAVTGDVSVVTGTPAGSPVAPAIPSGKLPVAHVLLQTSSTVITNSMITDKRLPGMGGGSGSRFATTIAIPSPGGTDSVAHGLGSSVWTVEGYIQCISTDLGYVVGDIVSLGPVQNAAGDKVGILYGFNGTNIFVVRGQNGGPRIPDKTGGATFGNIDDTKWEISLRAST